MRKYVYLSFSYAENEFRMELREVLKRDIRLNPLVWDDLELEHGMDWQQPMHQRVGEARIMIMLVSPTYLDHEKCQAWNYEIPPAIEAYKNGELKIFWIPTRRVRAQDTPFPELQAAHPLWQPLDSLSPEARRAAYQNLRRNIVKELDLDRSSIFDTFLSHNSKDKPAVRELADSLETCGLRAWLDERELVPGRPWQEALEEIIQNTKTAVVAVGPSGLGPWEEPEMRACLSEFVDRKLPVIPVLLPGAPQQPELPLFLKAFTWVDLRGGITDDGLDRLVWGITGVKPTSLPSPAGSTPHPPVTTQAAGGPLATWKEKLAYLQEQEAIIADPAQKFALKKQIEEAHRKIKEFSGNP